MTSQYDIYGIGNAIVDIEVELDDTVLQKLKIDKGVMTLIDEERHHQLLEEVDGIHHRRSCGGSAGNTIVAASQLGCNCFYSCRVANDASGELYISNLQDHQVTSNMTLENRPEGHTGKSIVMVTPDAERTMNTFLGVANNISEDELALDVLKNSKYLYIEGFLVTSPQSRVTAIRAKKIAEQHRIKTALTFSDPNMSKFYKDGLLEMLGDGVDLLFCNSDEAKIFSGTKNLHDAIENLKHYAKNFAITLGCEGSLIYTGESIIEIPPCPTAAIDTVGAGDSYAGGLLYALTQNYDYNSAGHLASMISSKVVSRFGARLTQTETKNILDDFIKKNG